MEKDLDMPQKPPHKQIFATIPTAIYDAIREAAIRDHRSFSSMISKALADWLKCKADV